MAGLILEYIDSVPIQGNEDKITFELQRWLTTLADTVNSTIEQLQQAINTITDILQQLLTYGLTVPSFTTTEINALAFGAPDGTMWYCTDSTPPNIVAKINGSLVQLNTSPFP